MRPCPGYVKRNKDARPSCYEEPGTIWFMRKGSSILQPRSLFRMCHDVPAEALTSNPTWSLRKVSCGIYGYHVRYRNRR